MNETLLKFYKSIFSHPRLKCCGEYPARYPFNSEDGAQGCCNGKTFNALSLECCNDALLAVGTCSATAPPETIQPGN